MRNVSDGSHLCARQIFVIIPESREGEETTASGGERRKRKTDSRRGKEAIDIDFVPLARVGGRRSRGREDGVEEPKNVKLSWEKKRDAKEKSKKIEKKKSRER